MDAIELENPSLKGVFLRFLRGKIWTRRVWTV